MSTGSWQDIGMKWSSLWNYGPGNWIENALCAQTDPELFFPNKGQSSAPAKLICFRCTVRKDCLNYALNAPTVVEGVWGGTTERQRRSIRKGDVA